MSTVVEMTNGATLWAWCCSDCIERRKADGWTVKVKNVIAWGCDDCGRAAQLATGYATPTVAFLSTTLVARLPTRAECPPPPPIAQWPKPTRKGRVHQQPISEGEAA